MNKRILLMLSVIVTLTLSIVVENCQSQGQVGLSLGDLRDTSTGLKPPTNAVLVWNGNSWTGLVVTTIINSTLQGNLTNTSPLGGYVMVYSNAMFRSNILYLTDTVTHSNRMLMCSNNTLTLGPVTTP